MQRASGKRSSRHTFLHNEQARNNKKHNREPQKSEIDNLSFINRKPYKQLGILNTIMAKKAPKKEEPKTDVQNMLERMPQEMKDKIGATKVKLDSFTKQILDKFDKYIVGISLLPPPNIAANLAIIAA